MIDLLADRNSLSDLLRGGQAFQCTRRGLDNEGTVRAFNGQPITVRRHTDRWTPNKDTGPVASAAYTVVKLVKTTALDAQPGWSPYNPTYHSPLKSFEEIS